MPAPRKVQDAEQAIRHFESIGREVVGVAILKDGYKLEFAKSEKTITGADLVNMGQK